MFRFLVGVVLCVTVLVGSARGQITAADADFDGDGVVDFPDFLLFVDGYGSSMGQTTYKAKFDFDNNGAVDFQDFLAFIGVFGKDMFSDIPRPPDSNKDDWRALVALYKATDGDNWTSNRNWLSDRPLGEWYRVYTNEQGRVVRLELWGNELSGSIPSKLGDLANLSYLHLGDNQLSGSIPSELGNFTKLWALHLGNNQLSGSIPESIGNLTNLESLGVSYNQLSGSIPSELGNLKKLERLDLGGNHLTGPIPEFFGNFTKLRVLSLGGNQLSGSIPSELGNLTDLEWLTLHFNQLSGSIPSELGNLTDLELLWLRGNHLTGFVPFTFQNLTNLKDFVYAPFVCMPNDVGMQQWGAKAVKRQLLDDCLSPVVESWPPKADLIRQLENLGWFSVRFENTDDFDHLQIYAIFEAVQKWNKAIVGFPSHVSVPMQLSVKRSYEGPGPIADSSITFYPASERLDFFFFRDVMIHEIGHNLGIVAWGERTDGNGNVLYTKTAGGDRWVFNGVQANLKYKELKGNWDFEDELITDGAGHWLGRFLKYDVMTDGPALSTITLSALVDMGYKIDMTQADKLPLEGSRSAIKPTLSSAPMHPHTWCGGIGHVPHSQ